MQKRRDARRVDGFLLYDKPKGRSSNAALQHVRRIFRAERAGHTGTLDPMASGLLVICFGQSTRFAGELLGAPKTYLAELTLGTRTDTGDAEGKVISSKPFELDASDLEPVLGKFQGEILQVPPMHSALKRDGVPLYRLARQGIEVPRNPRPVTIHSICLQRVSLPTLQILVTCSKGTYIRVLAEDIGQTLGCGAFLSGLVRLGLGPFQLQEAQSDESLASLSEVERDLCLQPPDRLISTFPGLILEPGAAERFGHGQAIAAKASQSGEHRVYDAAGQFLGTGVADGLGMLHPKRVFPPGQPL
jgi:tRNA pseudouridine55 synthase